MSLIHYARPFLELGICKEYCMARKITGNDITNRSKRTGAAVQPTAVQAASEVNKDVRKNGKAAGLVPASVAVDLEEEIRRRAYELYLQRAASAGEGNGNGNENQDWLIAEREIRSRHASQEHQRA